MLELRCVTVSCVGRMKMNVCEFMVCVELSCCVSLGM